MVHVAPFFFIPLLHDQRDIHFFVFILLGFVVDVCIIQIVNE